MRASVLSGVECLEVRDVPFPQVAPREVLIRVGAVGLCGTDAHIFAGHANYNTDEYGQPIPFDVEPQVLGHEISGFIEEAGSEVCDLRSGGIRPFQWLSVDEMALGGGEGLGTATERIGRIRHVGFMPEGKHGRSLPA